MSSIQSVSSARHSRAQKKEFGERLKQLIASSGLHHAEFARRAGLERNHISTYVTGRSYPSPGNLEKIARTLGVPVTSLAPEGHVAADRSQPRIQVLPGRPDLATLQIDRVVSFRTARQILELLEYDDAALQSDGHEPGARLDGEPPA